MQTIPAPRAGRHSLQDLQALVEAARHMGACTPTSVNGAEQEIEIDIDREIWCLELLSGVVDVVGHGTRQTRDYVAWIASICADAADRGASAAQMLNTVEAASHHYAPPWRNLADLLARRCAMFVRSFGIESVDGPSGEIIRWLFVEAWPQPCAVLH